MLILLMLGLIGGYLFANWGRLNDTVLLDPILSDPTLTPTISSTHHAYDALLHERDGELDEAIEAWESAIEVAPDNPTYYKKLADLMVLNSQAEDALTLLDDALDVFPDDDGLYEAKAGAHIAYGEWLQDHGESGIQEFVSAISVGRTATKINTNNARAYAYISGGYLRQSNEDWHNASIPAATALELAPDDEVVLYHAAEEVRYVQGNPQLAIAWLQQAIEKKPDYTNASLELAGVHNTVDQRVTGIEVLKNALDYDPCNAVVLDRISRYYIIGGADPEAERNAMQAVECDPELIRAYGHLGWALFRQRNYERARDALETAIDKYEDASPENALFFALLGLTYYRLDEDNCPKAIPLFEDALENSDPNSAAYPNAVLGLENCG